MAGFRCRIASTRSALEFLRQCNIVSNDPRGIAGGDGVVSDRTRDERVLAYDGTLSEGSGENLFLIYKNKIHTPNTASSILPGITRDAVITIAKDLGYEVLEQTIPREMLYIADEVFFTGTAAEVTPIRSIDKIQIGEGKRGPVTTKIQSQLFKILSTEVEDKYGWLDYL